MATKNNLHYSIFFLLSIITGVILGNILWSQGAYTYVLLFCIIFMVTYSWNRKYWWIFIIGILLMAWGVLRTEYNHQTHEINKSFIATKNIHGLEKVGVTGEILKLSKIGDTQKRYTLKIITINEEPSPGDIKLIVSIPKNLTLSTGDILQYKWYISSPEEIDNFHYPRFLLSKGVYGSIYIRIPDVISESDSQDMFQRMRLWWMGHIYEIYPKEVGTFLAGILLWERRSIQPDLREDFTRSGLMHIIAVSGFNVSILIVFCGHVFRPLPGFIRLIFTLGMILFFLLLVGWDAPIIRASIMGSIAYIGLFGGFGVSTILLILVVTAGFGLVNPLSINYDISLQLSVLAVCGIIFLEPVFQKIWKYLPTTFAIRESMIMTCCAIFFTLPLSIVYFGQVPLIAFISNLLVTMAIPPAMLFGFLSIILHAAWEPLGIMIGYIGWNLLSYILWIVKWTGDMTYASIPVQIGEYAWYFFIMYYLILGFIIILWKKSTE